MTSKLGCRAVLRAAICIASLGLTTAAFADARAFAYIGDERNPGTTPDPVTGSVTAVQTGGPVGGSQFASASADAGTGVLKATAQAGIDGGYVMPATASAQISENILFSGGYGGTAYLDWSFHGDITLSNSPYNPQFGSAYGQFNIYASIAAGSAASQYVTLSPFPYACGAGCVVGTSIETNGTIAIPINEYGAFIQASLSTNATYGNLADFGNTSKLYLRLPDGVTFTSTSGQFLKNAAPILTSPVPEPSSVGLMLGGLAVVGAVAWRKRPASA